MPLARILASRETDASFLCEQLHTLGFVVEVLDPRESRRGEAEVEISLDRVPLAQALDYVVQRSHDLGCDVWVAPEALPDLQTVAGEHRVAEPVSSANWEADSLPDPQTWEQPEHWEIQQQPPEHWTEPELLLGPDLAASEDHEISLPGLTGAVTRGLTPDLPQEAAQPVFAAADSQKPVSSGSKFRKQTMGAAALRRLQDWSAIFLSTLGTLFAAGFATARRLALAGKRQILLLSQKTQMVSHQALHGLTTGQRQSKAAVQKLWQQACLALRERREVLLSRRKEALRQREANKIAIQAAMVNRARENAKQWRDPAGQSRKDEPVQEEPALPQIAPSLENPASPARTTFAVNAAGTALPQLFHAVSPREPSVWIDPELIASKATPSANNASEVPAQPLSTRALRGAARFWGWTTTTPAAADAASERRPRARELQWRRAAVASVALALAVTLGFAAGMRRSASSLLPSQLSWPAASVEPAPEPSPIFSKTESNTAVDTQNAPQQHTAVGAGLGHGIPNEKIEVAKPSRAIQTNPRPAAAHLTRDSQRKTDSKEVIIRHFEPDVVVRHFEPASSSASKTKPKQKDGVRYYSDLD